MTASLFGSGGILNANVSGTIVPQAFTATAGQTVFTITSFTYTPNTNSVFVYINGTKQLSSVDFQETSSTAITLIEGCVLGDRVEVVGIPTLDLTQVPAGNVNYLLSLLNAVTRSLYSRLTDTVSVKDFGAVGDNSNEDYIAFQNASASSAGHIYVPPGNYKISANVTFNLPLIMAPGAVFYIASGVTFTVFNNLQAGVYKIFNCPTGATVVFNKTKNTFGYAEWWGAVTGGGDTATAINAALIALPEVRLQAGYYEVASAINLTAGNQKLVGVGSKWPGVSNLSTRLLSSSSTLTVLQVGATSYPGSYDSMVKNLEVRDLYVGRLGNPAVTSNCAGVLINYCNGARLDNVSSADSIRGFSFSGAYDALLQRCESIRILAGTGGTDLWDGFYFDGSVSAGNDGSNYQTKLSYCRAVCTYAALQTAGSRGFNLSGKLTGVSLDFCAAITCYDGLEATGTASASISTANTDFHIRNCRFEDSARYGIHLLTFNKSGAVTILDPWIRQVSTSTYGIYIESCIGTINILGGQLAGNNGASTAIGVYVLNSNGVTVDKTAISEFKSYGVRIDGSSNCDVRPVISSFFNTMTGAPAGSINTCAKNYFAPTVRGTGLPAGVQLSSTGTTLTEVNCSLIESAALTTPATKLTYNAGNITVVGAFGSNNLASGVMA